MPKQKEQQKAKEGGGTSVMELTPEQGQSLRKIVAEARGFIEMPDGSLLVQVRVEPEVAEVLRAWAEGAGETFAEYAQRQVETSLTATVLGSQIG